MAGLLDKKDDDRTDGEIDTAGMADISFLLLIFFLITTTFDTDTGIGMTLPPPLPEDADPPPVKDRNMLKILVNAEGQVLIEEKASSIEQIEREVRKHVLNKGENPDYSETPDDALVSVKTDRATPYNMYINALDEVKASYNAIYDKRAKAQGHDSYQAYKEGLGPEQDDLIREKIPLNISIAEPSGGEGGGSS
jgi:biopolymer transport protein ExbD